MARFMRAGAPRVMASSIASAEFLGGVVDPFSPLGADPIGRDIGLGPIGIDPCAFLSGTARDICEAGQDFFGGGNGGDSLTSKKKSGCPPFMSADPITGDCRFDFDPGPGTGLPGGGAAAGSGLTRPNQVSRRVLECPRFADGKTGILWMNALTGDVICLPRRTSGRGFGLIRKNKPRKKAFISAAQKKSLDDIKKVQDKAKKFATDAGFTCKRK